MSVDPFCHIRFAGRAATEVEEMSDEEKKALIFKFFGDMQTRVLNYTDFGLDFHDE